MSFISVEELNTHLYNAQIEVISGGDDMIPLSAIDTAVAEARGYLARYDRDVIFKSEGSERNAFLVAIVKDMAVFHYLKLCNYAADLEFRTFLYERAIDWLKQVQKGQVIPDLPILDEDGDGKPDDNDFLWGSNPKRSQHY